MARKLGRPTDQRMHVLRNQVSELLWYGRIETTLEKAKDVRSLAEKMITTAIKGYSDVVEVTKVKTNAKGEKVNVIFKNDGSKKLVARRKLMAFLRPIKELKADGESKSQYKDRTRDIKHPLIEKMFNEYAPFYDKRNQENGQGGGYTRVIKTEVRRGDAAQMAIVELVK